jgi:hypothetical protein
MKCTTVDWLHRLLLAGTWNLVCEFMQQTANSLQLFGLNEASVWSAIGFWKLTSHTDHSPELAKTIEEMFSHSSTILRCIQSCDHIVTIFHKVVKPFIIISCTWFCHLGPCEVNSFKGFLNCSSDFKNILNYLVSWDIECLCNSHNKH